MLIGVVAEAKVNALHHWPQATLHREYLRYPHMHEFVTRAWVRVSHSDRQVEIHDLRDTIYGLLNDLHVGTPFVGEENEIFDFGTKSCEEIAMYIMEHLTFCYRVEVLEEGKDGAEVLSVPQA